jgi:hypothetical protein
MSSLKPFYLSGNQAWSGIYCVTFLLLLTVVNLTNSIDAFVDISPADRKLPHVAEPAVRKRRRKAWEGTARLISIIPCLYCLMTYRGILTGTYCFIWFLLFSCPIRRKRINDMRPHLNSIRAYLQKNDITYREKIIRFLDSFYITFQFVFSDVVPPHTIYVTRKRRKESAKEYPSFWCYQLIQHAKEVCVDTLDLVLEIIKKYNIVMLGKRFKKRFISLVGNTKW